MGAGRVLGGGGGGENHVNFFHAIRHLCGASNDMCLISSVRV